MNFINASCLGSENSKITLYANEKINHMLHNMLIKGLRH